MQIHIEVYVQICHMYIDILCIFVYTHRHLDVVADADED